MLETLSSRSQYVCSSIKTFDLSTFYTTIPHTLLKHRNKELTQRCFSKKSGGQSYQYLVIGKSYFVKSHSKFNNKYKQDEIIQMLDYVVLFSGRVFQQTIGVPVGTNCTPLLADLFLHAHEADFLQGLLKNKDKKLAQTFNSSFCYSRFAITRVIVLESSYLFLTEGMYTSGYIT